MLLSAEICVTPAHFLAFLLDPRYLGQTILHADDETHGLEFAAELSPDLIVVIAQYLLFLLLLITWWRKISTLMSFAHIIFAVHAIHVNIVGVFVDYFGFSQWEFKYFSLFLSLSQFRSKSPPFLKPYFEAANCMKPCDWWQLVNISEELSSSFHKVLFFSCFEMKVWKIKKVMFFKIRIGLI